MTRTRRELGLVLALAAAAFVPFMGKAFHIDEPWFVEVAGAFARDGLAAFRAAYHWFGRSVPFTELNHNPPGFYLLLSLPVRLLGEGEWALRLSLLPVDLAAAAGLYLLAGRFLHRPLLPVLAVLAAPAYLINMNHLMAEKPAVALGVWGLYAFVRGWTAASAALLGGALLFKYSAAVFLPAALAYGVSRGDKPARLGAWAAGALGPLGLSLALDHWTGGGASASVWGYTAQNLGQPWAAWSHKLRSLLAFTGGAGAAAALLPGLARPPRGWQWAAALVPALLFLPFFDLGPSVRPVDRLAGAAMGCVGAWALWRVLSSWKSSKGGALWATWSAAALVLASVYFSVTARVLLLLVPPLAFAGAEALEAGPALPARRRWAAGLVAASAALSLALAFVDARHAGAVRLAAREAAAAVRPPGRLWCAGWGGLHHYLIRAGARELAASGGWDALGPGDLVLSSRVWDSPRPARPRAARVRRWSVEETVPLRLTSLFGGDAGFYTNALGFLPFALSREPLEEFTLVELL